MTAEETIERLRARIGQEIHVSDWLQVTQEMIDAFAEVTGDRQWIHVDRERAARESPWGTTIAHGYLTLSLFSALRTRGNDASDLLPSGVKNVINYGLDRLRFPAPVKAGARVRARTTLLGVEPVPGGLQITERRTMEIEGESKPACVADTIIRVML